MNSEYRKDLKSKLTEKRDKLSANSLQRLQEPTAIFELSVSNPNKTKNGVAETQKLGLEFGHDDLYGFFNQLERVQEQLDKLT